MEIRRTILGSSKQIIKVLQRYEAIKDLRVRKLEKISKLRGVNKEINLLVAKLRKEMPKAEMRIPSGPKSARKSRIKGDELAALESELKKIEEKIGMIG